MTGCPTAWNLADLPKPADDAPKVMTTFACGGGSSMGYKRAGARVLAANDIDPKMASHYQRNLNPPNYYLMPVGSLLNKAKGNALPKELYDLDVLDGSPPCSTFSTAGGGRQKRWGKKKKFREGQSEQVLSELFFDFVKLAGVLRPKVVVAENVEQMRIGLARGYIRLIDKAFREIGYTLKVFSVNAQLCGVPQIRKRLFFIAQPTEDVKPISMAYPKPQRLYTIDDAWVDVPDRGPDRLMGPLHQEIWGKTTPGSQFRKAYEAIYGRNGMFSYRRLRFGSPSCTLTAMAARTIAHPMERRWIRPGEILRIGTFPDDYQADDGDTLNYMVGMSVPPRMMQVVATNVIEQVLGMQARPLVEEIPA